LEFPVVVEAAMTPLHVTSRGRINNVSDPSQHSALLVMFYNIRSTAIQCLQFVYRPNFVLNIPFPCYIFIKQMSLFVQCIWGVSTYNFMFYMIAGRLDNCQF